MTRINRLIAGVVLYGGMLFSTAGGAAVISFNGVAGTPMANQSTNVAGQYTEFGTGAAFVDGFVFQSSVNQYITGPGYASIFGGDASAYGWNATDYLAGAGVTTISRVGGSPFSLSSFDAGAYNENNYPLAAQIQGHFVGGGSISQLVLLNPSNSLRQLGNDFTQNTLVGFSNLSSVTIHTGGSFIAVDNLAVAAVPEPSTYALMVVGLGVVGFIAKRRRKSQTGRNEQALDQVA